MKFHLPCRLFKLLMAVVCVPGTTIASELSSQTESYLYVASRDSKAGVNEQSTVAEAEEQTSLRWNSTGDDAAVWDTEQTAVWVDEHTGEETSYKAGSDVLFAEGVDFNKNVQITSEDVTASTVEISGSDYHFNGGDLVVTDRLSVSHSTSIGSSLVIGTSTAPLSIDVAEGETLTITGLETYSTTVNGHPIYEHGALVKSGGGKMLVTDYAHGSITAVTVQDGLLELGSVVSLDVGANEIKGGTLENVQMLVTGDVTRTLTGLTVTAHNLIKSADGVHAGVLRDVTLYAGTSTEYASLQNVVFAGNSTLTGYITFEETQAQHEMGVATGSTLTVDNVTFDLRGIASGTKALIVNGAVSDSANGLLSGVAMPEGISGVQGTIQGWDTVKFVYSGVAVNSAAVDASVAGTVTLITHHDGNLYWDGSNDNLWNPHSTNWSLTAGEQGDEVFTALSHVIFGGGNVAHRDITVTQDMVVMDMDVLDGGYSFTGARVAVLSDAYLNPGAGKVTFNDQLVVMGNLVSEGNGSIELMGATTVAQNVDIQGKNLTIAGDLSVGGKFSVNAGDADTAGHLNISGNVTAQEMQIAVSAGNKNGSAYKEALVNVTGNLNVGGSGAITIGGTAEQHYLGVLTAGVLTVNTTEHAVYFDHLHVGSLTVGKGAQVHVQTASAAVSVSSSVFSIIDLYGTLALDAKGATYDQGYAVFVQDDAAALSFGTGCTIGNMRIYGAADESGYTNLSIAARSQSATIEYMEKLGDLSVSLGAVTVKDATGAVHGTLSLDNGKLNLATDNFMAADSGEIKLAKASRLNIGSTKQNLSAANKISLFGASSITGDATGQGLVFADGAVISYKAEDNAIMANMQVNHALNISSEQKGSSLDISGKLSGNGNVLLSGDGTVVFSGGANSFSGKVTVGQDSTLSLQDAITLSQAGVILSNGGTLALDTDTAIKLNTLEFNSGSTLAFSTVTGTKDFSALDAALHVTNGVTGSGILNIAFSGTLNTLTTYNLLTGLTSIEGIKLNVQHNGVALDDSQYKVGFDAESGLLYMETLMGNVWEGKSDYATGNQYGIWSTTDQNGNWSGGNNYSENGNHQAAIFGDLDAGAVSNVKIAGTVTPKDVYLVADATSYVISAMEGENGTGYLASGTKIHKDGLADVTLQLSGNMDAATALGAVDIQTGRLILGESLAVSGAVTIGGKAQLVVDDSNSLGIPVELKMGANADGTFNYTASAIGAGVSATLSGVTMDAAGIRGVSGTPGSADKLLVQGNADLSYLTLTDFEAKGNVTLSHVTLTSSAANQSHQLENVTIGKEVVVDENGCYALSGNITFEGTLLNNGKVTLTNAQLEIGKINYTCTFGNDNKPEYLYQFISLEGNGVLEADAFQTKQVSINGINLAYDLADGVVADFKDNGNGSFTLSIGNEQADGTSDGTVGLPHWDERWGNTENAPGISRFYVGSDTTANIELAAGKDADTSYYLYNSVVNTENAAKVNGGNAIVVTLSPTAEGTLVSGSSMEGNGIIASSYEVWIDDRSAFKNIIGGLDNPTAIWTDAFQSVATHILVDSDVKITDVPKDRDRTHWAKQFIIGGTRWGNQGASWANLDAESFVTVLNGDIYTIFAASCGGDYLSEYWGWKASSTQYGTSHVFVDGGRIGEIFAGGMYCDLYGTQEVNGRARAVELVLTGGTLGGEDLRVFGGGERGKVFGDIYVRMEGDAEIVSRLVGGSNAGEVYGNITLDLISGKAFRVDAAGLGWRNEWDKDDVAYIEGEIRVNLYSAFTLGIGADGDLASGIYGGRELSNLVSENCTSTLHFAESATYNLGRLSDDGYTSSDESIIVTGFDRFTLEDKAHAVLALGYFDIDMDPSRTLEISGNGVVEVIGHGANFGRNIELTNGATLKVSTSVIGLPDDDSDDRTISVTSGTTLDLTGYPVESEYVASSPYAGLSFRTEICGDGVNGKGAIFKGTTRETDDDKALSVNRVSLPYVELTGNASIGVMDHEVLHMSAYELGKTTLDLNGYTLTKQGLGSFVARNVQMTEGTVLVHQGDFYIDRVSHSEMTDIVLADGTSLYLNATNSGTSENSLGIRTLSGAGNVTLNDAELTLYTTIDSAYKVYYMDQAQSYNQFLGTTGFGYGVFSGTISDGTKSGSLAKVGNGVHYITGSDNTYSGGTRLDGGRLYLLGSSEQSEFVQGSSGVSLGVAGTGAITWAGENAELYLGHNARIYNLGTTSSGVMTIGVEGVPHGVLADFVGTHSKENTPVVRDGVAYVEIDTHNLKSIAVNAMYADGTEYVANTDIDRNKMLLVQQSDWESVKNTAVTGFTDTGHNEAVYSGVLCDSDGVSAKLHKVGVGTLVLDQSNFYTGGTQIDAGTLRVRGWGTLGENEKDNAVMVNEGATLMFTHNSGYGNEPTSVANDITINGCGDERWAQHAATDSGTAALISAVGPAVTFTMSGDISGTGNVRHSGEGVLVLSGDNSYTGGMYASRGTVEVQSAKGLGATADGQGAVVVEADADLNVTVKDGHTTSPVVTTLAAGGNDIQGDVRIEGADSTERVLHMASNGYNAASTTLESNGTLLLNGEGVTAHTSVLTGNGTVAVSDATGEGASVVVDSVIDYTGDFRVEGDKASIKVNTGSFIDGSIYVSGRQASVSIAGGIAVADGESLRLSSTGDAFTLGSDATTTTAYAEITTNESVSVAAGAVLSVNNQATEYEYNLMGLEVNSRLVLADVVPSDTTDASGDTVFNEVGSVSWKYDSGFDQGIAINTQAAGVIRADGGLTLAGGATYEAVNSHVNLMGSGLTLDTMENSLILFNTAPAFSMDTSTGDVQLVLFSDVGSVYFGYDNELANAGTGIYYTQASHYLAGFEGIDEETLLVYDSQAKVVYLHMPAIPEPATGTLSLLALISLAARRRRAK